MEVSKRPNTQQNSIVDAKKTIWSKKTLNIGHKKKIPDNFQREYTLFMFVINIYRNNSITFVTAITESQLI